MLESHPDVTAAAVLAFDHPAGGKYLAAYLTASAPVPQLREYAGERLPEYMVPTTFIVLDAFPLTVNGKLDRRALPVPDLASASEAGRAPATPAEVAVAEIFTEVLNLDGPVSADDDFFRLGGHSLLATRLMARTNAQLGSALTLREVFEVPTVAGLAASVAGRPQEVQLPRVGDLARPEVLPLSYGQQSLWLIEQMGGPGGRYIVPTVLRLTGDLNQDALVDAVGDVVARHEALRTLLVEDHQGLHQVVLPVDQALAALEVSTAAEHEPQPWTTSCSVGSTSAGTCPSAQACCGWLQPSGSSCWPRITMPWTSGRSRRCWGISPPPTGLGWTASGRTGFRCRCSTPTTRSGSAKFSGPATTPTACWDKTSPTGERFWPTHPRNRRSPWTEPVRVTRPITAWI